MRGFVDNRFAVNIARERVGYHRQSRVLHTALQELRFHARHTLVGVLAELIRKGLYRVDRGGERFLGFGVGNIVVVHVRIARFRTEHFELAYDCGVVARGEDF